MGLSVKIDGKYYELKETTLVGKNDFIDNFFEQIPDRLGMVDRVYKCR